MKWRACSIDERKAQAYRGVRAFRLNRKRRDFIFEGDALADGGNSGFIATNAVLKCGVRRIVLVGFDMRLDNGKHWHPDHAGGLSNPRVPAVAKWRNTFNGQAAELARRGMALYRESDVSTLTAFPVLSLQDALERFP